MPFFCGIAGWAYALKLAGWPATRPVWTGSPPCQPFSAAGNLEGKDDARHLGPKFISLVRACRPLCCLANKSQARLCSESLQSALEANLNGPGSMIYQTVWKPHTTPLGRQIYRLRASGRRTSDSGHSLERSGWPSPTTSDTRSYSETALTTWLKGKTTNGHGMDLNMAGQLSGWEHPTGERLEHTAGVGRQQRGAEPRRAGPWTAGWQP